jgi:hypothetical protein
MKLKLEKIEELIANLKSYTNTTIELLKLETVQRTSSIFSNLVSRLIIGIVIILFAFFSSLGLSFYLSDLLGNSYWGFGIIAGFYLLLVLILIIGRKTLLIKPLDNIIIQGLLKKQENQE